MSQRTQAHKAIQAAHQHDVENHQTQSQKQEVPANSLANAPVDWQASAVLNSQRALTPTDVVQLQRIVGNNRAQRIIADRRIRQQARPEKAQNSVQRSVGLELEMRAEDWSIWNNPKEGKGRTPVAKGVPIVHGKDYQLQAEYSGENLSVGEMVTNPPGLENRAQYEASINDMVRLGTEMNHKGVRTDFPASDFGGGDPRYVMQKGRDHIDGVSLQVTAGVPLASMAALYKNLAGVVPPNEREGYLKAVGRAEYVTNKSSGPLAGKRSEEFKGLMVLIESFLEDANAGGRPSATYAKGLIKVMARTDFHKMFSLLPESDRNYIQQNMDKWIQRVLSGKHKRLMKEQRKNAEGKVFTPTIVDAGSSAPAMDITTTRDEWLRNLPTSDRLTEQGRNPENKENIYSNLTYQQIMGIVQKQNLGMDPSQWPDELQQQFAYAQNPTNGPYGTAETSGDYYDGEEEDLKAAMKDLYMGLGSLGNKTDFVHYGDYPNPEDRLGEEHEEGEVPTEELTAAPIIEIRNPPPAGPVNNWKNVADSIYLAIEDAIRFPKGKGTERKPIAPKNFTNVLTEGQKKMGEQASLQSAEAGLFRLRGELEEVADLEENK